MGNGLDISFTFSMNNKGVISPEAGFTKLAMDIQKSRDGMGTILKEEIQLFLQQVADATAARNSGSYPGGTTGSSLSRRSGAGIASIQSGVKVTGDNIADIKGTISGLSYMLTQEEGADGITPKVGKYICIPLDAALNADGTKKRISVWDWREKTFIGKSKDGSKMILYLKLSGRAIVPLYLLVTTHKVEPRLGLRREAMSGLDAFTERLSKRIIDTMLGA